VRTQAGHGEHRRKREFDAVAGVAVSHGERVLFPALGATKLDLALYYHTGAERAVVGLATVTRAAFPDPTAPTGEEWDAVEVAPRQPLRAPVTLAAMKADRALKGLPLLTRGRLSVMPVSPEHFRHVLAQAKASKPTPKPQRAPRKKSP
jgi:hypothetical protein